MSFYCGIDLSARDSHVCVINQHLSRLVDQKVSNKLPQIIALLEPYKADLQIVVESTFNWYWLVDGLRAAGFNVCLAHTLGLFMITGAKIKTDRRDAFSLAKLPLAGTDWIPGVTDSPRAAAHDVRRSNITPMRT